MAELVLCSRCKDYVEKDKPHMWRLNYPCIDGEIDLDALKPKGRWPPKRTLDKVAIYADTKADVME